LIVAVPWYALCSYRNGAEFPRTFFWVHHFERFTSGSLQHVQPLWFYAPILPELLFPWTPVMVALFRRSLYRDWRTQFLLACAAFTLIFFSASANKLPGYILPSIPALAALMGISLASMRRAGPLLFCSAALLSLMPVIAETFPASLVVWFPAMPIAFSFDPLGPVIPTLMALIPLAAAGAWAWYLDRAGRRDAAMILVVVLAVASFVYLKARALPEIDRVASARMLWRQVSVPRDSLCAGPMHRNWRYGLNYYLVVPLPDCKTAPKPFALVQNGPRPVVQRKVGQTIALSRLSARGPQDRLW
jgi:4-amino-4-deoxy-L-arabinose transferase-like glycosyltransferase